jgi:hypothetical protein
MGSGRNIHISSPRDSIWIVDLSRISNFQSPTSSFLDFFNLRLLIWRRFIILIFWVFIFHGGISKWAWCRGAEAELRLGVTSELQIFPVASRRARYSPLVPITATPVSRRPSFLSPSRSRTGTPWFQCVRQGHNPGVMMVVFCWGPSSSLHSAQVGPFLPSN